MGNSPNCQTCKPPTPWQQPPQTPNLYTNPKTRQKIQAHKAHLTKSEQNWLQRRIHDHTHNFIVNILHFHVLSSNPNPLSSQQDCQDSVVDQCQVFTEILATLRQGGWRPVLSALGVLKGFRRLTMYFGYFVVSQAMVKVNQNKDIKVWVNESVWLPQIQQVLDSEEKMLETICQVIMLFDLEEGCKIKNARTFNQAIDSLIQSLKVTPSPRVFRKDDQYCGKNNVRATKQTENTQIKYFQQFQSKQKLKNKLTPKDPKPQPPIQPPKTQIPPQIQPHILPQKNTQTRTQKNNISINKKKASPTKIANNTNLHQHQSPIKKKYGDFNSSSSANHINMSQPLLTKNMSQIMILSKSPTGGKIDNQDSFKAMREASQFKYFLHTGQPKAKDVGGHQPSDCKNTVSSVRMGTVNRNSNINPQQKLKRLQPPRTKTQQFYFLSNPNNSGTAPRFKTNHLPSTSSSSQLNLHNNTDYSSKIKPYNPTGVATSPSAVSTYRNMDKQKQVEKEKEKSSEKKWEIIQEELGASVEMRVEGVEERQCRDLLIRQKLVQKSKKHEDLKNAINKLLKQ